MDKEPIAAEEMIKAAEGGEPTGETHNQQIQDDLKSTIEGADPNEHRLGELPH